MDSQENLQWLQSLQSFLDTLLTRIIHNKETRYKFLSPEAMTIWARAFTHETVSPTDNYEDLEYAGDTILKWAFPKYMKRRFPFLDKGELTELHATYMSKMKQAELSRELQLPQYIRVRGMDRAILNLETDAFESFFGALEAVADSIIDGTGTAYCYNMVLNIFRTMEIDDSTIKGSAKTQVQQIFSRFELPKLIEQTPGHEVIIGASPGFQTYLGKSSPIIAQGIANTIKDAEYEAYRALISELTDQKLITVSSEHNSTSNMYFLVSLRPEHMNFLASYGVNPKQVEIGYSTGSTKKEAEHGAYKQSLDTLSRYGITTDWAEKAKIAKDFDDPQIKPYVQALTTKGKSEGYESHYFFIPRKTVTQTGAVVNLIGVKPNGQEIVLASTYTHERDHSFRSAKIDVLRKYLSNTN